MHEVNTNITDGTIILYCKSAFLRFFSKQDVRALISCFWLLAFASEAEALMLGGRLSVGKLQIGVRRNATSLNPTS